MPVHSIPDYQDAREQQPNQMHKLASLPTSDCEQTLTQALDPPLPPAEVPSYSFLTILESNTILKTTARDTPFFLGRRSRGKRRRSVSLRTQ